MQSLSCNSPNTCYNETSHLLINTPDSQTMDHSRVLCNGAINLNIDQGTTRMGHNKVVSDINDPSKTKGYIGLQPTDFSFIGPGRQTGDTSYVNKYLRMARIIRQSGLPKYKQIRIPLKSGLNIEVWKAHLHDYPDKMLLQYL